MRGMGGADSTLCSKKVVAMKATPMSKNMIVVSIFNTFHPLGMVSIR